MKFKHSIVLAILLLCCSGWSPLASKPAHTEANQPPFKMILRLWPSYFTDTTLFNDLTHALEQHPGLYDEVWLCMDFNSLSMDTHRATSNALARAAQRLRTMGISVSMEGITLGHGDDFASGNQSELEQDVWGPIVDYRGAQTRTCSCPRQPAFHQYLSDVYALYAAASQPATIMLDDDLRVTHHQPAAQLCFCDTCLNQFNRQTGAHWTRETLVDALENNAEEGNLRRAWIAFGQQSLAGVARTISRSVHRVSPSTRMGLEHANFHNELLEGHDWNPIFEAMQQETGLDPVARPGSGFYNDYAPRGMIVKALDMARQIRRLTPAVRQIAAEVEGYRHWATGKSPHGLCVESGLYMAMGTTQLAYAIVCAATEPMAWYADNYFRELAGWRNYYREFQEFNLGTEPGGVDPYISPDAALRERGATDPPMAWTTTPAGAMAYGLAPLGVPFCPDGNYPAALMMDDNAVAGIRPERAQHLFATHGTVFDQQAWKEMQRMGYDTLFRPTPSPATLTDLSCYTTPEGGRAAVIPTYNAALSNAERLDLLHCIDWAAAGRLPVVSETAPQMVVVPRIDSTARLRSVTLLNCTISDQRNIRLRLRGCPAVHKVRLIWKRAGEKDLRLKAEASDNDLLITVPMLGAWNTGWIAVCER